MKMWSFLNKKKEKEKPSPITSQRAAELCQIYAYRRMMKSGDYNNTPAYIRDRYKCEEVIAFIYSLGYKIMK